MYDLSKCISKSVWEKLELEYKYNKEEERISFGEDDITKSNIICPIVKKYNNLHVISVKDMANKKEEIHGLDFIIEGRSSEKYTFAFQAKILRKNEYPEIGYISGKKEGEYQVEKVIRKQREMRNKLGEDKYSAYYIFYNYLSDEDNIFSSVKDRYEKSFTSSHGVTAAPADSIYDYLTKIPDYDKEKPKYIPKEYRMIDKISRLTYPWEYIFKESEAFNPQKSIIKIPGGKDKTYGLVRVQNKPIPLSFIPISAEEIPQKIMSPEEYISYFYGEDKKDLLPEINIPKYVIFGKINFGS